MGSYAPIQLIDPLGHVIPHTAGDDILNISKFGTSNVSIVGYARSDVANSEAKWKIYMHTYDASGNIVRTRFASGLNGYVHIWTTKTGTAITGATQAATCEITSVGHGLVTGDYVEIDSMTTGGMVELNSDGYGSKVFYVTRTGANTFTIHATTGSHAAINSTGYAAYTTGGLLYRHEHLNYTWS